MNYKEVSFVIYEVVTNNVNVINQVMMLSILIPICFKMEVIIEDQDECMSDTAVKVYF